MGLMLSDISFRNFRNYESFMLEDLGPLTILVGPNAVGKTNVIEGIQLLTSAASFRHPKVAHLVRSGTESAQVEGMVTDGSRELALSLVVSEGKRRHALNGKAKRPVDLKGLIPSVVFTPDDLGFVKGSRSVRLSALDNLGSQLSPNHYLIRRDYEKVVRYKNRLLKEDASDDLIASIDEMLVTCGAQLTCYRSALFEKLAPYIASYYSSLSEGRESFAAFYLPSWKAVEAPVLQEGIVVECDAGKGGCQESVSGGLTSLSRGAAREAISRDLVKRAGEERMRRRALVGPHADQLGFVIDGRDAATFGSQGQQRSIVLAFKLAETALIHELIGQSPLLLLDDVMSELDEHRRAALVSFISAGMQTFVTTTNLSYFNRDLLAGAHVVELLHGTGGVRNMPDESLCPDSFSPSVAQGFGSRPEMEKGDESDTSGESEGDSPASDERQQCASSPAFRETSNGPAQMARNDESGKEVDS